MLDNGLPYSVALMFLLFGFLFGSCCGSGALCFLMRKQSGESWFKGRSHCDACGHVLGVLDLVPVFSYLFSGGKCRYCGTKIPKTLLFAEVLFAGFGLVGVSPFFFMRNLRQAVLIAVFLLVVLFFVAYQICKNAIVKKKPNRVEVG